MSVSIRKPERRKPINPKLKNLADKMRRCIFGTFTPAIAGVTYGFAIVENGGCEVFDMVQSDDFREEKFENAEDALASFIVNGKPLFDYGSDVIVLRKR